MPLDPQAVISAAREMLDSFTETNRAGDQFRSEWVPVDQVDGWRAALGDNDEITTQVRPDARGVYVKLPNGGWKFFAKTEASAT